VLNDEIESSAFVTKLRDTGRTNGVTYKSFGSNSNATTRRILMVKSVRVGNADGVKLLSNRKP